MNDIERLLSAIESQQKCIKGINDVLDKHQQCLDMLSNLVKAHVREIHELQVKQDRKGWFGS